PGYPASSVEGHAGGFVSGLLAGVPVLCAEGRIHGYEGHADAFLGLPARVLIAAGCKTLVITNAAGGIHPDFRVGDLMVITDHLNMTGRSPLTGPNVDSWGPRFPDISRVYDHRLREHFLSTAERLGQKLRTGVYACMPGPQYETPAEVRMLGILGADAVGMSTVPEAIIAAHAGATVLAISVICNLAAGISKAPLSHEEVMEQGQLAGLRLAEILVTALPTWPMLA
ncbi:MAG TPA: purine-nucleoside phosphorylase, partial [Planctomycetota bacterium]|nr:purine-nucleoside phosphorylase [Planctomycetota bacterium]